MEKMFLIHRTWPGSARPCARQFCSQSFPCRRFRAVDKAENKNFTQIMYAGCFQLATPSDKKEYAMP